MLPLDNVDVIGGDVEGFKMLFYEMRVVADGLIEWLIDEYAWEPNVLGWIDIMVFAAW